MFLQNKFVQSQKDLSVHSSGMFNSARIRQSTNSDEGLANDPFGNGKKLSRSRANLLSSRSNCWERIRRLLFRAKKKVLRAKHTHGLKVYSPPTFQKAWAPRPHHVSFAGTMWVDLTMVGVLYRLDEFFLTSADNSFSGFWIPYVMFLAVYDAWEVGPLLQAEFRNHGISLFHSLLFLCSWLLLALLGASIPFESASETLSNSNMNGTNIDLTLPVVTWEATDQLAFTGIKLAHSLVRVVIYADIALMSKSKRARVGALPRLVTYLCGTIPLLLAVILVLFEQDPVFVALCILLSYTGQKTVWNAIWRFDLFQLRTKAERVRTNMPFVITRLKDWTQLQLGACVLGLITENLELDIFSSNQFEMYFVLIASYFFLALMDLHSYSSEPRIFHDHALIVGGLASFFWFELFTILGISLMGVAVGLRYVFQHPSTEANTKPFLVWLLVGSSITATMAILLQEANHHTARKAKKGRKRIFSAKMVLACSAVIAPALLLNDPSVVNQPLFFVTLNLAVSTLLVIIVHAYFGGFRKEVAKKTDFKLKGRILAALIGRIWLQRARKNLAEREQQRKLLEETGRVRTESPKGKAEGELNEPGAAGISMGEQLEEQSMHRIIENKEGTPDKPVQSSRSLTTPTHVPSALDMLAATFAMATFGGENGEVVGFPSSSSPSTSEEPLVTSAGSNEDAIGTSVLETTEILKAMASFRKRSTMLPSVASFSRSLLIEDDDQETIDGDDDEEPVSVIDQEKDIFEDEVFIGHDDEEEDDEEEEGDGHQNNSSRYTQRTFHAATIDEGDEGDEMQIDLEMGDGGAYQHPEDSIRLESENPAFIASTIPMEEESAIVAEPLQSFSASNSKLVAPAETFLEKEETTLTGENVQEDHQPSQRTVISNDSDRKESAVSERKVKFSLDTLDGPMKSSTGELREKKSSTGDLREKKKSSTGDLREKKPSTGDLREKKKSSSSSLKTGKQEQQSASPITRYTKYFPTKKKRADPGGGETKPIKAAKKKSTTHKNSNHNRRLIKANLADFDKTVTTRVLKKVLNDRFYERPHLLAAQDVFAEYTVSWSDLFLDIVYVGVVYRLGDYLAQGILVRHILTGAAKEPLSRTIFLFASLFYAIFSLWWAKLGFSSKCGVTDVFHKMLDIFQALIVLICAANVLSPLLLSQNPSYIYVITACLTLFHLTMLFLWAEVAMGKNKSLAEVACSKRNIRRCVLSIAALGCAFLTCGLDGPLEVISIFWALSWLLPVLERFFTINSVKAEEKAPFLLRYVLHRLGDGALILLGEGVFQIIRAVDSLGIVPFAIFTLSFVNMALARIALFQMDCFDEHAKKHAVFNSRFGHVAVGFLRSLASPAIVGIGVALKLIVSVTSGEQQQYEDDDSMMPEPCLEVANYELLCVCSFFSLGAYFSIYHLHRTYYFKYLRWRHLLVGWLFSACFLIFPWIPCVHPLIVTGGCSVVWAGAIIFHSVTDDLFSSKDDQGVTMNAPKSENDQDVSRRATRVARKSMMKLTGSGLL